MKYAIEDSAALIRVLRGVLPTFTFAATNRQSYPTAEGQIAGLRFTFGFVSTGRLGFFATTEYSHKSFTSDTPGRLAYYVLRHLRGLHKTLGNKLAQQARKIPVSHRDDSRGS